MVPRKFVPRDAAPHLEALVRTNPVVAITGPRQSGKTTLARRVFHHLPYENLEDPETRALVRDDPRSLLERMSAGGIIDEVQRFPDLFSYLQVEVDRGRGPFVLTGSSRFTLDANISQSLAGRVAYVHLLPFADGELRQTTRPASSLDETLFTGAYPPVHDRGADPVRWYTDYLATYVERDVRQLLRVADLDVFQRFLRLCAGWVGQLLNLNRLATDCGIAANTARAWLGVLRTSYIVHLLPPHHKNFRKRLVKAPKLYFVDTGLAARLLGITDARQLEQHPARGPLFESWVVAELLKGRFNRGLPDNLYFWRNHTGHEVDVLADEGTKLLPVECKSGATLVNDWFDALDRWRTLAGDAADMPHLVYGGRQSRNHRGVQVLGYRDICRLSARI